MGDQLSGICLVDAILDLTSEPGVVFDRFLLVPDEVAHEVAQQLRPGAIARLGGIGELGLERLVDPEGEGGFGQRCSPRSWVCYRVYTP